MIKTLQNRLALVLVCLALLTGCAAPQAAATQSPATETPNPTPSSTTQPTVTTAPSPTATPLPLNGQQTIYDIQATINYYNRFIDVKSSATYTNKTSQPMNELVFIIYPTIYPNAIYIKSVTFGDATSVTNYRWDSHRMIVPLLTPLLPGDTIEVIHYYEIYVPYTVEYPSVFGQTGRQLNLAYWYPTIPPYDETEGWLVYEIAFNNSRTVGEYQTFESADFNVRIQFTDRAENMEVAAGALPTENDGGLEYYLPLARTFTLVISDVYTITERQVGDTLIRSYTFPEDDHVADPVLDLAEESLNLYNDIYSPYERDVLSIVESDLDINMEYDGIVWIQSSFYWFYNNTPRTDLTIIIPHEIAHQWFFGLVGNNQAMKPWLDEAFATYSEALFYEEYYPDHLEWYWNTRVYDHLPYGYIDQTIYLEGGVPEYFDLVYRLGAWFLQDLRETIGDEAFFAFLKDYLQQNRYSIATESDFIRILRQHTDVDLTPVLEEYFTQPPQ
jgi:hypothetical protein